MPENRDENVVSIPLRWESTEVAATIYANQMFITHAGNEFYLVFGEVDPIFGIDKDALPDHITVHPRVKIAVTPQDMMEFARVIEENVTNFQKHRGANNPEDDDNDD